MPPQLFAGGRRKGEDDFFLTLSRVDEDAVSNDDRRGLPKPPFLGKSFAQKRSGQRRRAWKTRRISMTLSRTR